MIVQGRFLFVEKALSPAARELSRRESLAGAGRISGGKGASNIVVPQAAIAHRPRKQPTGMFAPFRMTQRGGITVWRCNKLASPVGRGGTRRVTERVCGEKPSHPLRGSSPGGRALLVQAGSRERRFEYRSSPSRHSASTTQTTHRDVCSV